MSKNIYKKSDTVKEMVNAIQEYATNKGIDLTNKIPDDVNRFDDVFQDGGEGRCEHFVDLTWGYASQFGEMEDYGKDGGFEDHVWLCIDSAMKKLQKRWNKPTQ
jgi:hypothetical protein